MGCDPVIATAPATAASDRPRLARRLGGWIAAAALAAALLIAGATLAAALLGFERYVITGDSMSGTYDRGSLLFAETVPVEELAAGDVITYEPPARSGVNGMVTHRIVSIRESRSGEPAFRTKGDANESADPWQFTLSAPEQARAAVSIPYVGYAFAALGMKQVRMALIGLPALLVAFGLGTRMWRQAGEEARELNEIARARLQQAADPEGR